MTRWVLYDDGGGRFSPMTDLRSFAEVRTGALTALERFTRWWGEPQAVVVPGPLEALAAERGLPTLVRADDETPLHVVNARWRGARPEVWPETGEAWHDSEGVVVAASIPPQALLELVKHGELPAHVRRIEAPRRLYRRPWEVLDDLPDRLAEDLELLHPVHPESGESSGARRGDVVGGHRVVVDPTAKLGCGVVLDATEGPISIAAGASVGHGSVLHGPLRLGAGSVVADRTQLKANTVIGPVCKVGGEIGATIFQGHANKVHDGHLGDSWIGEWVNFGAGTTNSNLLNTYGEVSMRLEPEGPSERSGRTAMGCLVGDHVKFAILVRIMTGSTFGTGSMVAVTDPPRSVGRFRWLTDRGDAPYRLDRFLEVMATAQSRRGVSAGPAYLARLEALHAAGRTG